MVTNALSKRYPNHPAAAGREEGEGEGEWEWEGGKGREEQQMS